MLQKVVFAVIFVVFSSLFFFFFVNGIADPQLRTIDNILSIVLSLDISSGTCFEVAAIESECIDVRKCYKPPREKRRK